MTRISRRVLSTYLSLAVLVSVTPTSLSAAPPNVDPCTLLTIAEVEQTVGALKGANGRQRGRGRLVQLRVCQWQGCIGGLGVSIRSHRAEQGHL